MTLEEAAKHLLSGGLLVFPTETVYGLGAVADDSEAVANIFEAKGRPQDNPLILHVADREQVVDLVMEIPERASLLMDEFWPGPLTICFQKSDQVSDLVTAGLSTVCIRQPVHEMAHALLSAVGKPIAAPSANLSGKPSTTSFADAKAQLEQKGVSFLDGGETSVGLESTVVDCTSPPVRILRPGSVTQKQLEHVLNESVVIATSQEDITSPGQLLEHYAPQGKLTVVLGKRYERREWINHHLSDQAVYGLVGDPEGLIDQSFQQLCEDESDLEQYSRQLYRFLNWCDAEQAAEIFLELPDEPHELLPTLLNRLEKASRNHIVKVSKR